VPQEQFPPPEELLGLEISTSKYYFFESSVLGYSGFTPLNIRITPVTQELILEGTVKTPVNQAPL
jgi:hypothetical protein